VLLVIGGLFVTLAGWFVLTFISVYNIDVELHNQYNAQVKANEVIFDKVWKVIQQKAGVTEQYATQFKEIYIQIMDARYAQDNSNLLMKWIQESNPQFDASIYKDLSMSIEANRSEFARVQEKLIDIDREHNNLLKKFPTNIFLMIKGDKSFELKIVTSSKTEQAFQTGKEDDVKLFNSDVK